MTLDEGKAQVLRLLDEYSGGGAPTQDEDLDLRMTGFFDAAQKKLAQTRHICAVYGVERQSGVTEYAMPEDFMALRCVWRNGEPYGGYRWKAGKLLIPETDRARVEVEYNRIPDTIGEDTPGDYVFELAEDAAACMPYFVAAQCLAGDMVQDSSVLMNLYYIMVQDLPAEPGGSRRVRNGFFR